MFTGTDSHYPVALLYYNWYQQKQIWLSSKVWIWFRPSVSNYLRGWSHIFLSPWRKPAELCRDQHTGKRSCGVLSREDGQAAAVSCKARCSVSGLLYITLSVGPEGAPYLDKKFSVPSRKKGPKQSGCRQTESKALAPFNDSKFYSKIQQKCWGNRTVTETATNHLGAQQHMSFVSGWMCTRGGRMKGQPSFKGCSFCRGWLEINIFIICQQWRNEVVYTLNT